MIKLCWELQPQEGYELSSTLWCTLQLHRQAPRPHESVDGGRLNLAICNNIDVTKS